MTEWNFKKQIELHDNFYRFPEGNEDLISDPTKLLFTIIQETESWAFYLEDYDENYINREIQSSERMFTDFILSSDKRLIDRLIYRNAAYGIDYDMNELIAWSKDFIRAMLKHQSVVSSVPEVLPTILEVLGIFQLFVEKAEDAYDSFKHNIKYGSWEFIQIAGEKVKIKVPVNKGSADEILFKDCNKAFTEITKFMTYIKQNRLSYRLAELAHKLKVYCEVVPGGLEKIKTINRQMEEEEIRNLLQSDVVKAIVEALGAEKLKRWHIVRKITYEDGGHVGGTLTHLKRVGIVQHKRPYYWVNPDWYDRLGICPDKDGQ